MKRVTSLPCLTGLLLLSLASAACRAESSADDREETGVSVSESALVAGPKVGVLFASYGDIDSPDEAEQYVKSAVRDPDVSPIPSFLKGAIADLGWLFVGESTKNEYREIGGSTHYRATSRAQADAVAQSLRTAGVNARTYTGFVFTYPYIKDTMAQIQADGIEHLVVLNQGAQYSHATQYINLREVKSYLSAHPSWNAKVTGVKSYSNDRFRTLVGDSVQARIDSDFAQTPPGNVCIFLPNHGLPSSLPLSGDPAIGQMLATVEAVRARFKNHVVLTGFQNHDEFPGSAWTQPKSDDVARQIGQNVACDNVIINGRTSFTVDNLETQFDENVAQRKEILKVNPKATIVVEKMFNSEPAFVEFTRDVVVDALAGRGDLEIERKAK